MVHHFPRSRLQFEAQMQSLAVTLPRASELAVALYSTVASDLQATGAADGVIHAGCPVCLEKALVSAAQAPVQGGAVPVTVGGGF